MNAPPVVMTLLKVVPLGDRECVSFTVYGRVCELGFRVGVGVVENHLIRSSGVRAGVGFRGTPTVYLVYGSIRRVPFRQCARLRVGGGCVLFVCCMYACPGC